MESIRKREAPPARMLGRDAERMGEAKKTPEVDLKTYRLRIFGNVEREVMLSWEQLSAMPAVTKKLDISCATRPSWRGDEWTGIPIRSLLALAVPKGEFLMLWSKCSDYSANVPVAKVDDDCMVAFAWNGKPLEPKHGGPVRAVLPGHYAWKNTLWLDGIEVMDRDRPGSWESGSGSILGGLRKGEARAKDGRAGLDGTLFPKRQA
jgi:DMSO/TMAO reductase YedYZ molybdopterin-dependent catalytic subunit